MKIAIDKNTLNAVKKDNNEYIYLYDDEPMQELIKKGLHCIQYKYCDYVDVNLTDYKVPCYKKTTMEDKDYNKMPNKHDYKFAIIVPNYNNDHGEYNGKTYLRNCIESILSQTYKDFELIIVDDMSDDTSIETIESYKDDRLTLIKNIRKRYNGGSRNVGIEYASLNIDFDYFCFLDSDDWWVDNKVLETINNRLNGHELLTLGCQMMFTHSNTTYNDNKPKCYKDLWSLGGSLWCTAWARVIRKDKIVYFQESSLMEDRCWTYELADNISDFNKVTSIPEPFYVWNRMNTNQSVSIVRNKVWEASAWKHIGEQLMLIERLKHKEMIPLIKERIEECKRRANNGQYQQY